MTEIGSRKTRRAPQKTRRKRKSPLGAFLLMGMFFVMIFVGFKIADSMFAPVTANPIVDEDEETIEPNSKDPINILVIGTDERDNEPTRSDTLILASLYPETKEVKLLSIPRDTRVNIPGRNQPERINHAYAYGGPDLAKKTVEQFLDITVDNYIKTNFQGFVNIIDILGGLTYNVEKRMYYPDEGIDLQPGLQKLNGDDALAYVRFRSDGLGDIGRVERQQKFLNALVDNVASINTVWKIPDLIRELSKNVQTDLSTKDILYLATKFSTIKASDVESQMIPGTPEYIGGISYWIPDKNALAEILKEMELR